MQRHAYEFLDGFVKVSAYILVATLISPNYQARVSNEYKLFNAEILISSESTIG